MMERDRSRGIVRGSSNSWMESALHWYFMREIGDLRLRSPRLFAVRVRVPGQPSISHVSFIQCPAFWSGSVVFG